MDTDMKNAPFYPGLGAEDRREIVRKSELWSLVLTLHFNTDKKLFLKQGVRQEGTNAIQNLVFCSAEGANILKVFYKPGGIELKLSNGWLMDSWSRNDILSSGNMKYILGQLRPMPDGDGNQKGPLGTIIRHIKNSPGFIANSVDILTKEFYRKEGGNVTEHDPYLDNDMARTALRLLCGGVDPKIEDPNTIQKLKESYEKVHVADLKKAEYMVKFNEMFIKPKYLLIYFTGSKNIITGAFTGKEISNSRIALEIKNLTNPFRLYEDIKHIPADVASRLAFLKVVREAEKTKTQCFDELDLLWHDMGINKDLGFISHTDTEALRFYLFDQAGTET